MTDRKRGRPLKPAKAGTKASLGLKVTALLKARIEEAGAKSGRTQSQEAEFRLERTFRDDELLAETRALRDMLARFLANGVGCVR